MQTITRGGAKTGQRLRAPRILPFSALTNKSLALALARLIAAVHASKDPSHFGTEEHGGQPVPPARPDPGLLENAIKRVSSLKSLHNKKTRGSTKEKKYDAIIRKDESMRHNRASSRIQKYNKRRHSRITLWSTAGRTHRAKPPPQAFSQAKYIG